MVDPMLGNSFVDPAPAAVAGLCCTACGAETREAPTASVCPACAGILEVRYRLDAVREALARRPPSQRPETFLRYAELLPVAGHAPAFAPAVTALLRAPELARGAGVAEVHVKDETRQPSGSIKDRAAAVAVARAAAADRRAVACASTGNAAGSLAAAAAREGMTAHVFVPRGTPAAKLGQIRAQGARLEVVNGDYAAAHARCAELAERAGWYDAACATNPYLLEGKKTCGFEIAERTSARPVDWVVVPVGDGCTIAGIWKGLRELADIGVGGPAPRMLAVRAESGSTAASIAVATPRNGARAVAAVAASGGAEAVVADRDIAAARTALLADAGVDAEPAAAAALAGLWAAREGGTVARHERVVLVVTGSGVRLRVGG